MDRMKLRSVETVASREDEVQEVLRTVAVERIEAEFIVALRHGEIDGDITVTRPATPEERRRMGLDPLEDDELEGDE
jgi:hypothetical protein